MATGDMLASFSLVLRASPSFSLERKIEIELERNEAKEGEMKMESWMVVAECLQGDAHGLSYTNINNGTFTPSVLFSSLPISFSLFHANVFGVN